MTIEIPAGFQKLPEGLGFTDTLRPVYRRDGDAPAMGMRVQAQHTNLIGICHGGVLMTLADVAASWAINHKRGSQGGSPTINLSFDFISAAKEGDWLQAEADLVTIKRRFAFSSGVVRANGEVCCRFNGGFYLPDHEGLAPKKEILERLQRAKDA